MVGCRKMPVVGMALLVLVGCSRNEPDALAPASQSAPAAVDGRPARPAAQASESSLAIKRGVVTAAGDHAMFKGCDDKVPLWLIDESDGALTRMLTEAATSAYVEAYGERAPVPEDVPAARDSAGAFILEQLLYAGMVGETGGCDKPQGDYVVAARGNEPFWSVHVTRDAAVWRQPQEPQEIKLGGLESQDAEGTVSYRANAPGHTLELHIDAQSCNDSMSGEFFAFVARGALDGKPFKGCARVGTQLGH